MLEKGLEYKKTEDEETTEITGSQKRKRKPTPFIQRILNTVKAQICVKDLFSHAKKTHEGLKSLGEAWDNTMNNFCIMTIKMQQNVVRKN